jgi:periplasmic protein TonB
MKSLILLIFISLSIFSFAQSTNEIAPPDTTEVFEIVDIHPTFPGGMNKWVKYLIKNLRYPADAARKNIEGKVYVKFLIDSTGYIQKESVQVLKSVYPSLDQEAMRMFIESPKWIPGRISSKNKNVPVIMSMPIIFKLN